MATSTVTGQRNFVHSALLYHSQHEYLESVQRFVREAMVLDEPVLVAVPTDRLALLGSRLRGGATAELQMIDIAEAARNPSRLLALQNAFVARHRGRRVHIVSQLVWPGRTVDECLACMQHEALVNAALENDSVTALCLYDAERMEEEVLADARATHPLLWKCGSPQRSADYAPAEVLARRNRPLPLHPGAVTYLVRESTDLRPARSFAVDYAGWVGLSQEGLTDLQLIATELATNSLQYADGGCQLAFWRHDEHLVCEARDGGELGDQMAGRHIPGGSGTASRGLFLVNAMADLVRTHTSASGITIQAYLRLDPMRGQTG